MKMNFVRFESAVGLQLIQKIAEKSAMKICRRETEVFSQGCGRRSGYFETPVDSAASSIWLWGRLASMAFVR
jgi:hypothetical protein